MDSNSSSSAPRGDAHTANIGAGAQIDQFAQGENITQIKGFTAEQVRVLIADIRESYQPKPFDGRSPYVGLASFQEQDADRFFGREKISQELVARIATARFVVIAGPSGSGKSSLARAGLFHALRNGALDGSENWLYEILTPGRHPLDQLARVVSSFAKSTNAGDEMQQRGRADATLLHRWADIALGDQLTRRALLLVDQFEESFTQADETERAAFFKLLLYAATVENGRVTIVCGTRSDFIGNWAAYPKLNALLNQGIHQIPPMQPDELVSAIARPALQVGLQIDPELVKQILDDMRDAPGALPLMQFALDDLFEYAKSKGGVIALTRDDYLARGGLQQALSRHADAEFAKLNADEQHIARNVFANLIEPGRGSADTKRTALLSELVPSSTDAAQVKNVVDKLATARLVTTDAKTVTLAHERMIDAWSWLRRLVNENREAIALQNQINQDAQEWEQSQRDASYLYTGARLATAQEQVAGKKIELGALAREFVDEGIAARDEAKRKEAQRTRRLIMAFGAAAVVFAVLAVVAFLAQQNAIRSEARAIEQQQTAEAERDRAEQAEADALSALDAADTAAREAGRQKNLVQSAEATAIAQAKISRARELAALARSLFDADPYESKRDLATLLAVEANREPDAITFESQDTLREFVSKYPLELVLRGHESQVTSAQYSHDGKRIVTASDDGTARVWDAESGKELGALRGHAGGLTSAEFSRDGSKILTVGCDKLDENLSCVRVAARVWDAENGKPLVVLNGQEYRVTSAQFSPAGNKIVTVGCDGLDVTFDCAEVTARVWDVAGSLAAGSGNESAVLREDARGIVTAQFSPDGKRIVTLACRRIDDANCPQDTARIWDAANGEKIAFWRSDQEILVSALFSQISPSGIQIVTNNSNGRVRVLDAVTGQEIVVLQEIAYDVTGAQISPDGKQLVTLSAGLDGFTPRTWDMELGTQLATLEGHLGEVNHVEFSPDGKLILTASFDDGTARVWDATSSNGDGRGLAILSGHDSNVWSAHFSPDGKRVVTTGEVTARVWNPFGGYEAALLRGHTFAVDSAQFSPDGKKIVTTSAMEMYEAPGTARVWDALTGQELGILRGHADSVESAQFSPRDGTHILTVGCDKKENNRCAVGSARLWDISTLPGSDAKQLAILDAPEQLIWSARFSPDDKWIVTVGCDEPTQGYCIVGKARVWDASNGKEIGVLRGNEHITGAEFSQDGKQIVTYGCVQPNQDNSCPQGAAWVWNVTDVSEKDGGKEIVALSGHADWVRNAQFSRDGKLIVTGSRDGTARLWDAVNGNELMVIGKLDQRPIHAQFSPDGKKIVTVDSSGEMQVWDTAARKQIAAMSKPGVRILRARFSPDGKLIVTVTDEGVARLWDAASGRELTGSHGHRGSINDAEFSSDGAKIVTASWDKTARIHFAKIQDVMELAKQRIGQELTCEERKDYLHEQKDCPTP